MKIELNIGLNAGRTRYSVHTAMLDVIAVLKFNLMDSRVFNDESEDCLSILAETAQSAEEIRARVTLLAVRLRQECIACHCDAFSENIGPRPWTWEPSYFRRCNGQRLDSPQTRLKL